jgi:hypothetical protein
MLFTERLRQTTFLCVKQMLPFTNWKSGSA